MGTSNWISVLSVLVAGLSALYARWAWTSTRQALLQQALYDLHQTYSSAEMLDAVKSLWDFHREHNKDKFVEEYERQRKTDDAELAKKPLADRLDFLRSTIHYKRRIVSHFYLHLAHLYVNKIMPKDVLFSGWSRADLRIIPEVLLPIEEALGKAFGSKDPKRLITRLWEDAPKDARL